MITLNSIYKKYSTKWVIENLNLHVNKGEFYCLLGPNGAGKTTTLKLLAGLIKPTKGIIHIGSHNVETEYIKAKEILGYIPDTPFLYDNLTPQEFILFVGDVYCIKKDDVLKGIDYYFNLLQLDDCRNRLIKNLSHGMRQKVIYTANFIHHPEVYLIDEPLVGLDPYGIHLVKKLLREEINKGKTILMCTHILSIAEEIADRVGIIKDGNLFIEGTPEELKEQYGDSLEDLFLKITKPEGV